MRAPKGTRRSFRHAAIIAAGLLLVGGTVLAQPRGKGGGFGEGFDGPRGMGHGPHGQRAGGPGGRPPGMQLVGMIMHRLDLTDEQREQVRGTVRTHVQETLRGLRDAQRTARRNLGRLINDPESEEAAILDAARNAAAVGEQVALARHALVRQLYGLLTGEQQAELKQLVAERLQRSSDRAERRRQAFEN